jgi:hypothetical protein
MLTEADTCRTLVPPKLYAAGGTDNQIGAEESFTACRSIIATRRADRVNNERAEFFVKFGAKARTVPSELLEGELECTLPDVLNARLFSDRGKVNGIIGKFRAAD